MVVVERYNIDRIGNFIFIGLIFARSMIQRDETLKFSKFILHVPLSIVIRSCVYIRVPRRLKFENLILHTETRSGKRALGLTLTYLASLHRYKYVYVCKVCSIRYIPHGVYEFHKFIYFFIIQAAV